MNDVKFSTWSFFSSVDWDSSGENSSAIIEKLLSYFYHVSSLF